MAYLYRSCKTSIIYTKWYLQLIHRLLYGHSVHRCNVDHDPLWMHEEGHECRCGFRWPNFGKLHART